MLGIIIGIAKMVRALRCLFELCTDRHVLSGFSKSVGVIVTEKLLFLPVQLSRLLSEQLTETRSVLPVCLPAPLLQNCFF